MILFSILFLKVHYVDLEYSIHKPYETPLMIIICKNCRVTLE